MTDQTQPLDLNLLDTKSAAEAGIVVELEHPVTGQPFTDAEGKAFFIEILGGDADKVRAKERKQLDRYLTAIRKNKNPGDAEAGESDNIDRLAGATLSWYLPPLDGAVLPAPTEQIARKLYSDPRFPWIVEQLTKAIGDRARFFKKP